MQEINANYCQNWYGILYEQFQLFFTEVSKELSFSALDVIIVEISPFREALNYMVARAFPFISTPEKSIRPGNWNGVSLNAGGSYVRVTNNFNDASIGLELLKRYGLARFPPGKLLSSAECY